MCTNFQAKQTTLTFWAKFAQKWISGSESQKPKYGFGVTTSKIPCVLILSQNEQL